MGNNATENERYNLTWNLPVDSVFTYMIRLHFCEFQPQVTQRNDRQFMIFIANQTAEAQADIIVWSGGNRVPIYRDYAVIMGNQGKQNRTNLSIAIHPGPRSSTRHSDAILNGLEVFKLSDSNDNLAGPNPELISFPPPASTSNLPPAKQTKSNRTNTLVAAVVGGGVSGIIVLFLLGFLILRRRRGAKDSGSSGEKASWWDSFSCATTRKPAKTDYSTLPSDLCRHFSLIEIKTATNNFDDAFIIGHGGFGEVYKGNMDGGATTVAIKRLKPGSKQGAHEFKTEIEMLSQLRHLHLVSLIGYCKDDREMILVYDYMARGNLRDHLYNTRNPPLPWKQRLEICIGAARGLHYLHTGAKRMIIHRDVKSTNILLDEKWVAKVSDFGLSKINPNDMSNAHVSTEVKGSFGYLDPEYYRRRQLTEKSDVYSFGVVLFEVLCARAPLNKSLGKDQVSLAAWATKCYENGTLDLIIDPHLTDSIASECLKKYGEIGVRCLHNEGIQRPSMNDVVWSLEFALQLQESAEKLEEKEEEEMNGGDERDANDKIGEHLSSSGGDMTTSHSGTSFSTHDSERVSSGAVFSEIFNPKAR